MNLYPQLVPKNFNLALNIMHIKSPLTLSKPLRINICTLFNPSTHWNKGFSSIGLKKYPCIMNLYPQENTQKFQFDVKYYEY